jgi:hypothetical protein
VDFRTRDTVEDSLIGKTIPDAVLGDPQRRDERDSLLVLAVIRPEGSGGDGVTVRVRNVSSGGLMAEAPDDYRAGLRVEVQLEGIGRQTGTVAWSEAGRIGIAFDHPVDKARARKPVVKRKEPDLLHHPDSGYRRPGLKPRS